MPAANPDQPIEALPVGEDEFRLIADSAPVAVWVTRLDRKRSFVNRAYVEFLAVSYEEALDFDWRAIIHPDDAVRLLRESIAGEASLQTFELEGRYRRADGAWRWLHSTSQPRWDARGRHIGFIGLHAINWRHRSATGGLVLGERDVWGRGYATDAVRVRTRFAFDRLNLHRIEGHTTNPAMRRVYEKCGYHHEGTLRQKFWRDGQWLDAEFYAILQADFAADGTA